MVATTGRRVVVLVACVYDNNNRVTFGDLFGLSRGYGRTVGEGEAKYKGEAIRTLSIRRREIYGIGTD